MAVSCRPQKGIWLAFAILGAAAVLLLPVVYGAVETWHRYEKIFGYTQASQQAYSRRLSSYAIDAQEAALAVRQLEVACLKQSIGEMTPAELTLLRRQAHTTINNFAADTPRRAELSKQPDFDAAYEALLAFVLEVEAYQNKTRTIASVITQGDSAANLWWRVATSATVTEYAMRDSMESAINEFRLLAERGWRVGLVVVTISLIAIIAGMYALWLSLSAERVRLKRIELLLATIAHDLRSPLQALVGAAHLAATSTNRSDRIEFADVVADRSRFFVRLLDDLLDLFRGAALTIVERRFALSDWLVAAQTRYSRLAADNGLELIFESPPQQLWIKFDEHRLSQCVDNLVGNAVRYTDVGTVAIGVSIDGVASTKPFKPVQLNVTVRDTGRGISKADLSRIFLPFVRLDNTTNGMGLGLSIVSTLARQVGGTVRLDSVVGVGSTFKLSIPIACCGEMSALAPGELDALIRAPATPRVLANIRKSKPTQAIPRVLVIDDDPIVARVLADMIRDMGYESDMAIGGRNGIAMATRQAYAVVVTDIQMPQCDGFEVARQLTRLLSPLPVLVAIIAKSSRPPEDETGSLFVQWLQKPVDPYHLAELLMAVTTDQAPATSSHSALNHQ